MKPRLLIPLLAFVLAPAARAGAVYVVAESMTPGYESLDMNVDMSVSDPFTNPYFNQVQQDSATFTGSWYFTRTRAGVHQIDLSVGANVTTVDAASPAVRLSVTEFLVPLYARYNYNVTLSHNTFVYFGTVAGGSGSSSQTDLSAPGITTRRSNNTVGTGMLGVGLGLKYFGEKWGFDIGYDYRLNGETAGAFDSTGRLHITTDYRWEHVFSVRGIIRF